MKSSLIEFLVANRYTTHAFICYNILRAPVAQWIRASVFGTEGRRFESYPVYHVNTPRKWGFCVVHLVALVLRLDSEADGSRRFGEVKARTEIYFEHA